MKQATLCRAAEMLADMLNERRSLQALAERHGLCRSTVSRQVQALVSRLVGEHGESARVPSLRGLRRHRELLLKLLGDFDLDAGRGQLPGRAGNDHIGDWAAAAARVARLSRNGVRDVALLQLMLSTGARPLELALLRVRDLVSVDGQVQSRPLVYPRGFDGGRSRRLVLDDPHAVACVREYLELRRRHRLGAGGGGAYGGLDPNSMAFLTHQGLPFPLRSRGNADMHLYSPSMVALLKVTLDRAGLAGLTAMGVRRQLARRMACDGMGERALCDRLGVSAVESVRALKAWRPEAEVGARGRRDANEFQPGGEVQFND